jgi:uncharacterized protein (DUF1015 family)
VADIAAFRGILFDPLRVSVAKVLAPPYDVISPEERARLAAADPHNVVRLDLPEADKDVDKYAAAAKTFEAWQASGVLRRDDRRAFYRYQQSFSHADLGGRETIRAGFIAAVKLQPFADRVVLPHERTLSGPKQDRLALLKATGAHFSQVFAMYRDPSGEVERLLKRVERSAPIFDVRMPDGVRHVLWRCADAETIGKVRHQMASRKLYIADGHHRYETMLAYRDELAARQNLSQYSSANYGSVFLCDMEQEGMVILPTHRILHSVQGLTAAGLLDKLKETCMVDRIDGAARDLAKIRASVDTAPDHQPAIAVVFPGDSHAWRITLSPKINPMTLGLATPAVAKLDVTLLHGLVLEKALGLSREAQEAQTNLRYVKDAASAFAELDKPGTQAAFLLGAAKVDTVRQVAEAGEVMPQKSTFFFPKLASGVVMSRVEPDEDLV